MPQAGVKIIANLPNWTSLDVGRYGRGSRIRTCTKSLISFKVILISGPDRPRLAKSFVHWFNNFRQVNRPRYRWYEHDLY